MSLTEAQDTPTTLTAAATVNDEHPNTPALTLSLTLRVVDVLVFTPDRARTSASHLSECALCLAYGDGGESKRRRRHLFIAIHIPANFTDSINFTPSDRVVSLTAELTNSGFRLHLHSCDDGYGAGDPGVAIGGGGSAAAGGDLGQRIGGSLGRETGVVASLSVSGGGGTYTYSVGGDFAVSADGLLSLATAQSNVATLTATVVVNDTHRTTRPGKRFLDPDDSRAGFIYSGRCHPELITHADGVPATLHRANLQGRFGDAKLCLGIHESE